MNRPKNSNADEWKLYLTEIGIDIDNATFLAVQICEAIEDQEEICNTRINQILDETNESR